MTRRSISAARAGPVVTVCAVLAALGGCNRGSATESGADSATPSDSQSDSTPASFGLLAADLGGSWFETATTGVTVANQMDPGTIEPDLCQDRSTGTFCMMFAAHQRTAFDGTDEIAFAYSPINMVDGPDGTDVDSQQDLISRVYAVDRQSHATRWHIRYLDFSEHYPTDICNFDPGDPCHPSLSLPAAEYWLCSLHMVHDFVVTDEDATSVGLWVADTRNDRMVHATLDKTSDCAVVDEIMNAATLPAWSPYRSVNSVQYSTDGTTESMLVSNKDAASSESNDGSSRGKLVEWRRAATPPGATWQRAWEYPAAAGAYVNAPHGASWYDPGDGHRYVIFAQSLGASDDGFGAGSGGSVSAVQVDDATPVYMTDLITTVTMGFPRDVSLLPGNQMLWTDSGCIGFDCGTLTADYIVSAPPLTASGLDGAYSRDHSQQSFVTLPLDGTLPMSSVSASLFSTDVIPPPQ